MSRLLATTLLIGAGIATASAAAQVQSQAIETRHVLTLREGWRFRQDNAVSGAESPNYSAADWAVVSLPHTWNRVGYYLHDPAGHLNHAESVNKQQGVGWYRLAFTPPDRDFAGKKAWLEFDGASRVATVWLNGVRLGEHQGGFSCFRFDVTTALRPGQPNLLVVRTDNSEPTPSSLTADVLPLAGDFFVHGGLYRPARLIASGSVHIDMLDFGGPGVYATTTDVTAGIATVAVRSRLRNDDGQQRAVQVVTKLVTDQGQVAASSTQSRQLPAAQTVELSQSLRVTQARLWQGTRDPFLYHLVTEIRGSQGELLDRLDQRYGLRQISFDPSKGLILNGALQALHGTGYHQDREGKGWATSETDIESDLRILIEMGVNTIRLTHYQHGQAIHDLADRHGLILWDELPLVSVWTQPGRKEPTTGLVANARQQLQELIRQNFNHASVANWSIANEVDFGNSIPGFLQSATEAPADPLSLLAELRALARAEDPGRPSSLATCCEDTPKRPGAQVPLTAASADFSGANRYFGWYYGAPSDLGPHLDGLHAKRPTQPQALTEYGAGAAISVHTDDPRGGPPDLGGSDQPEEYQSYVHEQLWPQIRERRYLWASWMWTSFDFASTARREGDSQDINTKGLITFDRKVKKDAYFFYRANWTSTPTVHINSARYADRAYAVTDVRVYSNAANTELWVNDALAGTREACVDKICVWPQVHLSAGQNTVVARARFASGVVEDRAIWRIAPTVAQSVHIDAGALVAAPSSSAHFGSDAFFTGGQAGTVYKSGGFGRPSTKLPIAGATDADIDATYREGEFRYDIPLPDGAYRVTLSFVEPSARPGERTFNILANDTVVLADLDVAAVDNRPTLVQRSFPIRASGGRLTLQFVAGRGKAIVSAIEVVSESPPSSATASRK